MPPTILITRPEPAATQFAKRLHGALGGSVPILVSPVMRVEETGVRPDLANVAWLIFTSRNGVSAFLGASARRDIPCYCVGDATANAARAAGMTAISCGGGAEDLVAKMQDDGITGPSLHLRGAHSVGQVAARLTRSGIPTTEAILYRQVETPLTAEAQLVLRESRPVILPFFSPRSAKLFFQMADLKAPAHVVALSDNVAGEVPTKAEMPVLVAERPDAVAMIVAIEQVIAAGKSLETGNGAQ